MNVFFDGVLCCQGMRFLAAAAAMLLILVGHPVAGFAQQEPGGSTEGIENGLSPELESFIEELSYVWSQTAGMEPGRSSFLPSYFSVAPLLGGVADLGWSRDSFSISAQQCALGGGRFLLTFESSGGLLMDGDAELRVVCLDSAGQLVAGSEYHRCRLGSINEGLAIDMPVTQQQLERIASYRWYLSKEEPFAPVKPVGQGTSVDL